MNDKQTIKKFLLFLKKNNVLEEYKEKFNLRFSNTNQQALTFSNFNDYLLRISPKFFLYHCFSWDKKLWRELHESWIKQKDL